MRSTKNTGFKVITQMLVLVILALVILPPVAVAQHEGLALYLPLNEGTGDVATDLSGNGNDGALFGGATWMPGKYDMGIYLDGVDGYMEIPNVLDEEGTIEFWFKPDWDGTDAEDYRLFDASAGPIYFFISKGANHYDINPEDFGFYLEDANDTDWQDIEFDPAGVIKAGKWYHTAVTWEYEGGFAFLYLNGEEIATSPDMLGPFPALNPNPRFGLEVIQYIPSRNGAKSVIDEVAIYNRALTEDEIKTHMEQGVLSSAETVERLINLVESMDLHNGIERSLCAKLEAVLDALLAVNAGVRKDAANKLEAFANAVAAQRGKELTDEQADQLIRCAKLIISAILDTDGAPAPSKERRFDNRDKLSTVWGKLKAK